MADKKLTKEQVETLQKCKSKEEVEKFAKENQLTDEELEKVVGGGATCPGISDSNGEQKADVNSIIDSITNS